MNGIAHGIHSSGFRPFASPQRRISSASSHPFVPSIDGPTSQSPTLPGPTPGGPSPYYTPPSSGLRPSTSASSFASSSTLNAQDALVTTSSDDGSSNVSHSLGETEMIASFPQFYERVRALCLKFNDDAANLLVSFNNPSQEPTLEASFGSLITFLSRPVFVINLRSAKPRTRSARHHTTFWLNPFKWVLVQTQCVCSTMPKPYVRE